jgi:hypothetical protein
MSKISNKTEGDLLNAVFNKTTYTSPTTWIALFTTTPTDTGGTEVTGSNAYARQEVAPDTLTTTNPNWTTTGTTGTAKKIENADTITFPQATGDWGSIPIYARLRSCGKSVVKHREVRRLESMVFERAQIFLCRYALGRVAGNRTAHPSALL